MSGHSICPLQGIIRLMDPLLASKKNLVPFFGLSFWTEKGALKNIESAEKT